MVAFRQISSAMLLVGLLASFLLAEEPSSHLDISWSDKILTIRGNGVVGESLEVWYLEAYCRANSTDRDWKETVIPHTSKLVDEAAKDHCIQVQDKLADGVVVNHFITAEQDAVSFRIEAHNPTEAASAVHWAQPCVRVDRFTGTSPEDRMKLVPPYAEKCFIFVDDQPVRLPTKPWATDARYVPGQVYCPPMVPRSDVNPRPLSEIVPSSGLMACLGKNNKRLIGVAFEPCQELFQGVITCIHSDIRIGGLAPGETKTIRGKIYFLPADLAELRRRYHQDFDI